jgi:hypothetical protein
MKEFLWGNLPINAIENRLVKEEGKCYLEFENKDEDLLSHLGVIGDKLVLI